MNRALRLACALAAAWLVACAMRVEPAPVEPHLKWGFVEADPSRPRLGIAPFRDARPLDEQRGQHPRLRLHWTGLVREGVNRTGNSAFANDLVHGAQRDVRATLARSGLFSSVRELGPQMATGEFDLVLHAEIEALSGEQAQRQTFSPVEVGWLRNRFSPARGRAVLRYEIHRTDGRLGSGRIQTRAEPPGGSITRAALDALALASEELVARLQREVVVLEKEASIPARVLDLCDAGEQRVRDLFERASRTLVREAGFDLQVRFERHAAPARPADAADLLARVRRLRAPEAGIVVALAPLESHSSMTRGARRGLADPLGRHAVVACSAEEETRVSTLLHEIGHLLGAVHVRDRSSVMHETAEFDARFFDPLNRRVLRVGQALFARPLDAATRSELGAIYRAARQFSYQVETADLAAAEAALNAGPR
jgi:hypothetical protein